MSPNMKFSGSSIIYNANVKVIPPPTYYVSLAEMLGISDSNSGVIVPPEVWNDISTNASWASLGGNLNGMWDTNMNPDAFATTNAATGGITPENRKYIMLQSKINQATTKLRFVFSLYIGSWEGGTIVAVTNGYWSPLAYTSPTLHDNVTTMTVDFTGINLVANTTVINLGFPPTGTVKIDQILWN